MASGSQQTPARAPVRTRKLLEPCVPLEARLFDREHFKYRAGAHLQIRERGGYEPDPLALRRDATFLAAAYADPHVLGHDNVRHVAGTKGPQPMRMPDFKVVRRDVWEVPAVAPAVAGHSSIASGWPA